MWKPQRSPPPHPPPLTMCTILASECFPTLLPVSSFRQQGNEWSSAADAFGFKWQMTQGCSRSKFPPASEPLFFRSHHTPHTQMHETKQVRCLEQCCLSLYFWNGRYGLWGFTASPALYIRRQGQVYFVAYLILLLLLALITYSSQRDNTFPRNPCRWCSRNNLFHHSLEHDTPYTVNSSASSCTLCTLTYSFHIPAACSKIQLFGFPFTVTHCFFIVIFTILGVVSPYTFRFLAQGGITTLSSSYKQHPCTLNQIIREKNSTRCSINDTPAAERTHL